MPCWLIQSLFVALTYDRPRKLGYGGLGEVRLERDFDKRKFAIKYLLAADSDSIARFPRELDASLS